MNTDAGSVGSLPRDTEAAQWTFAKFLDQFILGRTLAFYGSATILAAVMKLALGLEDDTATRRCILLLVSMKYMPTRWLPYVRLSGGPSPVQITCWDLVRADLRYASLDSSPLWLLETLRWTLFNFVEACKSLLVLVLIGVPLLLTWAFTPNQHIETALDSYNELNTGALAYRHRILVQVDVQVRSWISRIQSRRQAISPKRSTFRHRSIELPRHIRLLRLRPRLPFQQVAGALEDVRLAEAPPFVAISYTWGNPEPPYYVILDQSTLRVTENAYRALHSLTSAWRSKLVWIDSICIDQTSVEERNQQVQLMQDIYERAKQTVVCLGAARDAHLAIQLLGELAIETQLHPIHKVIGSYQHEFQSRRFVALNALVRNPWFDRVWIIQEVVMSSNLKVCYGNQRNGWEELIGLLIPRGLAFCPAQLCHTLFPDPQTGFGANGNPRDPMEPHHALLLNVPRQQMQQGAKLPLFHLLYMTLAFNATLGVDKVFALQGISAEGFSRRKPDYERSAHDVFVEAARDILCSDLDHRLSLLSVAGTGGFKRKMVDLPSWVPEWGGGISTTTSLTNPGFPRPLSAYDFNAHGMTAPDISFGLNADILILGGLNVDQILVLGEEPPICLNSCGFDVGDPSVLLQFNQKIKRWTEEAWHLAQAHARTEYPTGQPLIEAFWRTCIGDRLISPSGVVRPAPPGCYAHFQAALKWRANFALWTQASGTNPGSPEYEVHARKLQTIFWGGPEEAMECNRLAQEFEGPMGIHVNRRRFCVTQSGYIGIVPQHSQVGDRICVIYGAQTPFVFRCTGQDQLQENQIGDAYELIGECYFHGMMDGEIVSDAGVERQQLAIR